MHDCTFAAARRMGGGVQGHPPEYDAVQHCPRRHQGALPGDQAQPTTALVSTGQNISGIKQRTASGPATRRSTL